MKEFDRLLEITDTLLGPQGCPWDRAQTLKSIRSSLMEEASEVIDAINGDDDEHLVDELGDLFFNAVFLSRLAEIEQRGDLKKVLLAIEDKLVRRHPHVFGEAEVEGADGAKAQWEELKKLEKTHKERTSLLDGIPKGLGTLQRAQKIARKIKKSGIPFHFPESAGVGSKLFKLVLEAIDNNLGPEEELGEYLAAVEKAFRQKEAALE